MGFATPSIYDQLPGAVRRERTGQSAVERLAVDAVRREIAAMPASLVVQLALWPGEVAAWAREIRTSESLVYNMLAARKPYVRTRALLAERLEVSIATLDHLIEARRAVPGAQRGPAGWDAGRVADGAESPAPSEPIDWSRPPYPRHRDGANPIERRAVRVAELDVGSMPAATVVGLAMWPESLSAWSRAERLKSSVVWATLAGSPSVPVRDALARRLGVSLRELDALVTDARAVPTALRPPPPPPVRAPRDGAPPASPARPRDVQKPRDDGGQLGLGF